MDNQADLKALYEISAALNSSFTTEEALLHSFSILSRYLHIEKIGLFVFDPKREEFSFYLGRNFSENEIDSIRWILLDSLMKLTMDMEKGELDEEKDLLPVFSEEGEKKVFYLVPLSHSERQMGFLIMIKEYKEADDYRLTMKFTRAISGQISVILYRDYLLKSLMREKKYIELLYETSKILSYTFNEDNIIKYVLEKLHQTFSYKYLVFFILGNDKKRPSLIVYHTENLGEKKKQEFLEQVFKNIAREVHFFREDIASDMDIIWEIKNKLDYSFTKTHEISLPFTIGTVISGFFKMELDAKEYQPEVEQTIRAIIYHLSSAIEKAREFHKNLLLANTDGLTGLLNHRAFQELLKKEFDRSVRYKLNLSLLMLDIDFFKKFNDTYGHQTGDVVLQSVARILQNNARKIDIVARYGGEEFAIVMPETDLDGAKAFAERIRKAIEENEIENKDLKLKVTVSIGIGTYNKNTSSWMDSPGKLIEIADKALYLSKERGRNRVSNFEELEIDAS